MLKSLCLVITGAFIGHISAQCVPQPIQHTETGDELCRVLLKDLADVEVKAANISRDVQGVSGCVQFQNLDFFTQLIVTITADNFWLDNLLNSRSNPTGDECVAVNTRIDFDIRSIQAKASTPVPGSNCDALTGSALSQFTLQRFGVTLTALTNSVCGTGSSSYGSMGKWSQYVKDLRDGIVAVQKVIADNDVTNCVSFTRSKLGSGIKGFLEAGGYTSVIQGNSS